MCADRHWKLVYRWISAHITLLAEHPPISGSFLFFSITIIRIKRRKLSPVVQVVLMEFSCTLRRREIITSFLWNILSDYSEITVCMPWNSRICCFRKEIPPIFGAKQSSLLRHSEHITPPFATFCIAKSYFLAHRKLMQNVWFIVIVWLTAIYPNLHFLAIFLHFVASEILQAILRHIKQQSFLKSLCAILYVKICISELFAVFLHIVCS